MSRGLTATCSLEELRQTIDDLRRLTERLFCELGNYDNRRGQALLGEIATCHFILDRAFEDEQDERKRLAVTESSQQAAAE